MIHLLLRCNFLFIQPHITLLNKVLLIQAVQLHSKLNPEYNFKQPLQRDNQFYKLYHTRQLKIQNEQPGLTINTLNFNTLPNHVTSKNLSKAPLQTIVV